MLMIERDKHLRAYTAADFVKYFGRLFQDAYKRPYKIIFARDCAILLKVMRKFFEADVEMKDIFPFLDKMFIEYPKRRRIKAIDLNWVYSMVDGYLRPGSPADSKTNKVKAPEVELSPEMKAWLKSEKDKWLK